MATTLGALDQPLGNTRLQTVRLIAFLLASNNPAVNEELARLGTLASILVGSIVLSVCRNMQVRQKYMQLFFAAALLLMINLLQVYDMFWLLCSL